VKGTDLRTRRIGVVVELSAQQRPNGFGLDRLEEFAKSQLGGYLGGHLPKGDRFTVAAVAVVVDRRGE
jgi:hypothetical protein